MKARQVALANGRTIITEAGEGRCWDSEEVAAWDIEVPVETECDICHEEIKEGEGQ